jgi:hypothetical protein
LPQGASILAIWKGPSLPDGNCKYYSGLRHRLLQKDFAWKVGRGMRNIY